MNLRKVILSILGGASVGYGGSLLYRHERDRRRQHRARMEAMGQVLRAAFLKLSEVSKDGVSASEIYYFIWILERICSRHNLEFPDFGFKVKDGLLYSATLTHLLRRMLSGGELRLEGSRLHLLSGGGEDSLDRLQPALAAVIDETAAQWMHDFPEEQLVRFGRLFR